MTALLTIPEAAGRLSVAPRTVRRMLAAGELTRVTIRRAVRVTPESVEEYLRCHTAHVRAILAP